MDTFNVRINPKIYELYLFSPGQNMKTMFGNKVNKDTKYMHQIGVVKQPPAMNVSKT